MAANDTLQLSTHQQELSHAGNTIRWPSLAACVLGAMIVFGVGFASPEVIHGAAHDTRHSMNFACH